MRKLIAYASSITTLEPGDVLSTGTPDGVGPLEDNDSIVLDIEGLGGPLTVKVRRLDGRSPTAGSAGGYLPVAR